MGRGGVGGRYAPPRFPFPPDDRITMGHPKVPLRSKAAHLVSDLTPVILNPISEPPCSNSAAAASGRDEEETKNTESTENGSKGIPDGPDTSSFTAFMVSFLSSSESVSHYSGSDNGKDEKEDSGPASSVKGNGGRNGLIGQSSESVNHYSGLDEGKDENKNKDISPAPAIKGNGGRKGLIGRGKKSVCKVINKAAKISGYRYHKSEKKSDGGSKYRSNSAECELAPMNDTEKVALPVQLPDMSEPSSLLSESLRRSLYESLPVQAKGKNWVLVYSTWRHGISLANLYRRSMLCPGHNLLIVGDQDGAVFGGLVETPLLPSTTKKYQGTNKTFVFTSLSSDLVIFHPTGANRYFTLCSTEYLAMGGGDHFALYLQEDLLGGSSSSSETFDNSCLAHAEDFKIKDVELWGFVYASKYEETLELCRTEVPGICRW